MGLRPWPQPDDEEKLASLEASLPPGLKAQVERSDRERHERNIEAWSAVTPEPAVSMEFSVLTNVRG